MVDSGSVRLEKSASTGGVGNRGPANTALRVERADGSTTCSCTFYNLVNFSLSDVHAGVTRNFGIGSIRVILARNGRYGSILSVRPFNSS